MALRCLLGHDALPWSGCCLRILTRTKVSHQPLNCTLTKLSSLHLEPFPCRTAGVGKVEEQYLRFPSPFRCNGVIVRCVQPSCNHGSRQARATHDKIPRHARDDAQAGSPYPIREGMQRAPPAKCCRFMTIPSGQSFINLQTSSSRDLSLPRNLLYIPSLRSNSLSQHACRWSDGSKKGNKLRALLGTQSCVC